MVTARTAAARGSGLVLAAIILGIGVVGSQGMVVSPILPDVARALAASEGVVGIAVGAYGFAVAGAALLLGPSLDRHGRARTLVAAFAVLTAGLLVCAAARSPAWLALGQAVAGAAAGAILPSIYAFAGDVAPDGQRARFMSRVLLGWSLTLVGGVPLGGVLGELVGWRGVFLVLALASAVMALAFLALPEPPRATAGERARVMDVLAIPPVRVGLLVCLLNMAGFYGTYAYLGAAVRAVHQGGGGLAGLVVLAYGLGFTADVPLGGLMDKLSPRRTLALSMAALAAIFLVLPAATRTLPALLAVMAVLGIVQHTALNGLVSILGSISAERRGSIMALQSVATYVGLMAGTAAMGPVYDRFGFPTVSWTSAVLMAAAALAGLRLRRL